MTSPRRGGREGVEKILIWDDFQGLTGVTGGGRGVKKLEIGVTSFMDGPLCFKTGLNEDQLYHAKKQSYGV